MRDMSRIEIIPLDNLPENYDPKNPVEWSGPVEVFMDNNELTEQEIEHLAREGYVVMSGGAAPMVCVRYAEKFEYKCHACGTTEHYAGHPHCSCEVCFPKYARLDY